jgi:4-hydroxy-tetrahydrodipicolinate synthase
MHGVIAAVPTPLDAAGAPRKNLFLSHCHWLMENGCDGLNILGTTGEANSFSTSVRKTIMGWAAENLDREKLMVGTGTPSLDETIDLTRHAEALGYKVALILPPYYYKPVSDDGLFAWFSQVSEGLAEGLGEAGIAIYLYNFPQLTGLTIPAPVIAKLHTAWPRRFAGIKDSSGDLAYSRHLARTLPEFRVFPSSEVTLGEAGRSGFAGCISATVNQSAPLCATARHNRQAPDGALVEKIGALRARIAAAPLIPAVKYLVGQRTGQGAWENVLPPLCPLSGDHKAALAPVVDRLDAR